MSKIYKSTLELIGNMLAEHRHPSILALVGKLAHHAVRIAVGSSIPIHDELATQLVHVHASSLPSQRAPQARFIVTQRHNRWTLLAKCPLT